MTHLFVHKVADYKERVTFYFNDSIYELVFPSPYLNHFPTKLTVSRSDGSVLQQTEYRASYEESFVRELIGFWRSVVAALTGPAPDGAPVWYQKHMTHHLLPHIEHGWIHGLRNLLLIRDPREVVASYVKSRAQVEPDDIGLRQQVDLYEELADAGTAPPVIDSGDFLRAPEAHLRAVCEWLGIGFDAGMLQWPQGPRASDGIWAPHWYAHVWGSTGFEAPQPRNIELSEDAARVAEACRPHYQRLHALRLRID